MGLPWQFAARFESFGVPTRSNIFELCAWKADLSIEWRISQVLGGIHTIETDSDKSN